MKLDADAAGAMIASTEAYGLTFGYPLRDTAVGASLRDYGEFARPELDFILSHARQSTGAFLDVGANLGAICLPFAALRPSWQVVAVEALDLMAQLLVSNISNNGLDNVDVLAVAAGAESGEAEFPAAELHHGGNFGSIGFYTTEVAEKRRIVVKPLDAISPPATRIVKVDVEGFEPEVLRGSVGLLRDVKPVWLIESHPSRTNEQADMRGMLRDAGYRLFLFFSPFVTPSAPKGQPTDCSRGDLGIAAPPPGCENTWDLPELVEGSSPPRTAPDFPYLARYGF